MPAPPAFPDPAAPLPGEADLLAKVVADLRDDTAKLVYADWLEERDDPRGPFLRAVVTAARAKKPLPDGSALTSGGPGGTATTCSGSSARPTCGSGGSTGSKPRPGEAAHAARAGSSR